MKVKKGKKNKNLLGNPVEKGEVLTGVEAEAFVKVNTQKTL